MYRKKLLFGTLAVLTVAFFLTGCSSHRSPGTIPDPLHPKTEDPLPVPSDIQAEDTVILQEQRDPAEPPTQEAKTDTQIGEASVDPSEILEKALAAYQESQVAWDQGDLDSAIATLDDAYDFILKLDLPSESPLIQEKNDLRLLIAQRIQQVYASRLSAVGENHQSIPLIENKWVLREIKSFQNQERKYFEESYRRSGRYRTMILEKLREAGLPEELSWVPQIESGFKFNAYSRARALGLWQFISSTGYRFGLKRDRWIDERMDPEKATEAACKYLAELHSFFGDWTTALASYNCGEYRVQRLIKSQRINYLDNFWDLLPMLPRETSRFVPRIIATLLIIQDPAKYGMNLPTPDPPLRFDTIQITKPLRLSDLSNKMGFKESTLADLNPELRHKSTPDAPYSLKIPPDSTEKTLAAVNDLSRWIPPEATYVIHYVRRGETVSGIAGRYRTSVSAIGRLNSLGRRYLIRPGQRLKVPSRSGGNYAASRSLNLTKEGDSLAYTVKRGDSLYVIAQAFRTTIHKIKSLNNLTSDRLNVGQKLIIQSGTPDGATFYIVKSGDTPYKIAERFGMSLGVLLQLNSLSQRSKIYPGQKLWVTKSQ